MSNASFMAQPTKLVDSELASSSGMSGMSAVAVPEAAVAVAVTVTVDKELSFAAKVSMIALSTQASNNLA
eukprot:CAMPEP_0197727484 /NCGR_PEP_ID=MMETSP1434-20131217/20443_1 /TAXON_ID=265543 /ORGANISM="Minutocellus polymorphus, Strain CCMP3303" /LENGTH=69 /DNA_ID=CAMNT_0043313675 /DNA_START=24 /DNA_END=230 /DNA_ORIENTATION=-